MRPCAITAPPTPVPAAHHDAGIGTTSGAPAGFTHRISPHVVQKRRRKARKVIQCRCEWLSAPARHEVVRVGDISRLRVDAPSGSHSDTEGGGGGACGEVASERANFVEDACSALHRLGRHGARIFHDGFGFGGIAAHDATTSWSRPHRLRRRALEIRSSQERLPCCSLNGSKEKSASRGPLALARRAPLQVTLFYEWARRRP